MIAIDSSLDSSLPAALIECRDAEDYFRALGVEYDEQVLAVGCLHILKLFGKELTRLRPRVEDAAHQSADLEEIADLVVCRAALERAYQGFLAAGPLRHRVFKVLEDRAPGQFIAAADVPIEDLWPVAPTGGECL